MYHLAILNSHPIQYFAPLYRRLAQEPEIDLTVYYCSQQGSVEYVDPGFGERIKWDIPLLEGYKYKFLPNLRHHDQVDGFLSLINPTIISELRKENYDALVVYGHNFATYVLAIGAAKVLGVPVLMRCETHLLLDCSPFKRILRKPLMTLLYGRLCAACLSIGTRNEEFYRFHGVNENRFFRAPYAVDNHLFMQTAGYFSENIDAVKHELGLPLGKPLILFASKLMRRKRPMDVLMAYHRVRNQNIDAALLFVGSGEQEEALRDYVKDYQIPDVYFFGFRNQSELPKFYAAADVFAFPSENEPWGLIINEAMCAGLPVITTEVIGAVADLVRHGDNGFTFRAGDVDQLTSHLIKLLTDGDLRERMGEKSRAMIAKWDYERCVEGIRAALTHLK